MHQQLAGAGGKGKHGTCLQAGQRARLRPLWWQRSRGCRIPQGVAMQGQEAQRREGGRGGGPAVWQGPAEQQVGQVQHHQGREGASRSLHAFEAAR